MIGRFFEPDALDFLDQIVLIDLREVAPAKGIHLLDETSVDVAVLEFARRSLAKCEGGGG